MRLVGLADPEYHQTRGSVRLTLTAPSRLSDEQQESLLRRSGEILGFCTCAAVRSVRGRRRGIGPLSPLDASAAQGDTRPRAHRGFVAEHPSAQVNHRLAGPAHLRAPGHPLPQHPVMLLHQFPHRNGIGWHRVPAQGDQALCTHPDSPIGRRHVGRALDDQLCRGRRPARPHQRLLLREVQAQLEHVARAQPSNHDPVLGSDQQPGGLDEADPISSGFPFHGRSASQQPEIVGDHRIGGRTLVAGTQHGQCDWLAVEMLFEKIGSPTDGETVLDDPQPQLNERPSTGPPPA